ncbi:MAG: HesA/MoeB/ThiF family protein [Verrucomicrobiota bacterium]
MDASNGRPDVPLPGLGADEAETYAWQMDVTGMGEASQRRLRAATVMVSRVGGLGGVVAMQLAAAGVGRLVLVHGGLLKASDMNRQLLMRADRVGRPRMECVVERLREINPRVELVAEPSHVTEDNAARLVGLADVVVDCAPLFRERYLMNREAMRRRIPMVEAAVRDLELHVTTFQRGSSGCLRCLYPEESTEWLRRFPVIAPVPGVAGSIAALEVLKVVTGMGRPLTGRMLVADLGALRFRTLNLHRIVDCPVCGDGAPS